MPRHAFRASGGCARAARRAPRPATSGCSAGGRSGSGRRKARCPTRWCRSSRRPASRWMATDELILARTLGIDVRARRRGQVEQPERLYAPYRVTAGGARVACGFRDHALSDLIGFAYAGWPAEAAADDFVAPPRRSRAPLSASAPAGKRPTISDHPRRRERLGALRRRRPSVPARAVSAAVGHPELRTVTMAEACAEPARDADRHLSRAPGSTRTSTSGSGTPTISAAGASWPTRASARRRPPATSTRRPLARAREEVLIAEGSDWFWWYGDDHSSDARSRIRRPVPAAPAQRLSPARAADSRRAVRQQHLGRHGASAQTPADGTHLRRRSTARSRATSSGWAPGTLEVAGRRRGHAPGRARRAGLMTLVRFGFDRSGCTCGSTRRGRLVDLLADGLEFSLKFLQPAGVRFSVRGVQGRAGHCWDRGAGAAGDAAAWVERGQGGATVGGRVDSRDWRCR